MKRLRVPLVAAAVLLCLAGLLSWQFRAETVEVVAPRRLALQQDILLTGRVRTEATLRIRAEGEGRLLRLAPEGGTVTPGEVVAELDDPEGRTRLEAARLQYEQAQMAVNRLASLDRPLSLHDLAQAEVRLSQARRQLAAMRALSGRQEVSREELAQAEELVALRESEQQSARVRKLALESTGPESRQRDLARREAGQQLALAELRVSRNRLVSPVKGTVVRRLSQPGSWVRTGEDLLEVAASHHRDVVAELDERWLPLVRTGQPAVLLADASPDRPFPGVVSRLGTTVDSLRGTVSVYLSVQEWPDPIRDGMTLSVQLKGNPRHERWALPLATLVRRDNRTGVWRVRDGRAEFRPLETGLRTSELVEVISGLAPDDQVISRPGPLREGQRLRVVP